MTERLISADSFRRNIDLHYPFNKAEQSRHGIADVAKSRLLLILSNEPTVEAIPVKWILDYKDKYTVITSEECDPVKAEVIADMLAEWAERR